MPHPFDFNAEDNLSINFITYLILLINRILKINLNINNDEIKSNEEQNVIINNLKLDIKNKIKEINFKEDIFIGEKFEKDNDELYHVDFLFAFSEIII